MEWISVIPAFGTLFLETFKEIKATLDKGKKRSPTRLELGTLLGLYGSMMKLSVYSVDIKRLAEERPAEVSKDDLDAFERFFSEVAEFGNLLREMNLQIVDIYYPSLVKKIYNLSRADLAIADDFNNFTSNQHFKDFIHRRLDETRPFLANRPFLYDIRQVREEAFGALREEAFGALVGLTNALEECRKIIADIVKENWEFKELVELDSANKPINS
jgi:hypothetical protein